MQCLSRLMAVAWVLVAGVALAGEKYFDIPPQELSDALVKLSEQADTVIMAPQELVKGKVAPAVKGTMSVEEALRRVLEGSGLKALEGERGGVTIREAEVVEGNKGVRMAEGASSAAQTEGKETEGKGEQKEETGKLEEVVVTAQKRVERLKDVPVPVTALKASELTENNQVRITDYYTRIPGLSVTTDNVGAPRLVIRGITTGSQENPTVATSVDDVPFGSSTSFGLGTWAPEFDPGDLQRVELLRGPQGALYGVSSLGGLLKYVTVDPSTEGVSGRVQLGVGSIRHGDGADYNVRASANIPLSDTFALRASAFKRHDAGYIDNARSNTKGVNEADTTGGHLSTLWQPSEVFSLKLNALFQDVKADGISQVDLLPGLGEFEQSVLPGTSSFEKQFQVYSANASAKLGVLDLVSVTAYSKSKLINNYDFSALGFISNRFFPGTFGAADPTDLRTTKFSQEVRVSVPLGKRVDWLLGGFYLNEDTDQVSDDNANNAATGAFVGTWLHYVSASSYDERSVFTDLTLHATNRFDIQFGGRLSRIREDITNISSGPYAAAFLLSNPSVTALKGSVNAVTYLVTPSFKISDDLMIYARLASGYRPGGPNLNVVGVPPTYDADKTKNYEIGAKGSILNKALSFDASVYYIDWSNIQLSLFNNFSYIDNAGGARSQGVELSVEAKLTKGLTLSASGAYSDAELTEDMPQRASITAKAGDKLPWTPTWSGNLSLDQEFSLLNNVTGFVGASISYVGDRYGALRAGSRVVFPSYTQMDFRTGIRAGTWTANLFVNNLADKRGVLSTTPGSNASVFYIRPRTIGLNLARNF